MRGHVGFGAAAARASQGGFQRLGSYLASERLSLSELKRLAIELIDGLAGVEVQSAFAAQVAGRQWTGRLSLAQVSAPLTADDLWSAGEQQLLACELARRRIALLRLALHRPIPDIAGIRTEAVTTTRVFVDALVAPARALHTILGQPIRADDTLASVLDRLVRHRMLSSRTRSMLERLVHEMLAEREAAWTRDLTLRDLDQRCGIHVVATSTDLALFHSKGARDVANSSRKDAHREGAFGAMTFVEARLGVSHNVAAVLVGIELLRACQCLNRLVSGPPQITIGSDTPLPSKHSYPEVALLEVVDALRCDGRLDRYSRRTAGNFIGTQSRDLVRSALASFRENDPAYARAVLRIDPTTWVRGA